MEASFKVVNLLEGLAASRSSTPAQMALAWLLAQRPQFVPIPGATRLERLDDNLAAVQLLMTAKELRKVDAAFSTIGIKGALLSFAARRLDRPLAVATNILIGR